MVAVAPASAQQQKPNILVIWGDDIGISNLSCYSHALMGYRTPNIDRLAKEGMMFIDSYGEQSCTAGRSSFITGQSVFRTGLHEPILMPWWTDPVVFVLLLVGWLSARFLPRRPPG